MNSAAASGQGRRAWIGYTLGAACLIWVFHDVRWGDLLARVGTMTWWLLLPAIAADIGSYATQGARWSLLLRPLARLSVLKATQAIYAGLFTNEVLPLRPGEVLRGYLASRWTALPVAAVFSSILVERFLDGAWMVLAFGALVWAAPLPGYLVDAELILAVAIFASAAGLAYLAARKEQPRDTGATPEPRPMLLRWIETAAGAVRSMGRNSSLYIAAGLSGLQLALQAVSFWLVMEAYGLGLPMWQGAAAFLIVRLGTMVPSAPSNVGSYQFFTVLGLMIFGVDKTVASGFSVVVFLILTIPLWVVGLFAFGGAGLDLRTVRAEAANLKKEWQSRSNADSKP